MILPRVFVLWGAHARHVIDRQEEDGTYRAHGWGVASGRWFVGLILYRRLQ